MENTKNKSNNEDSLSLCWRGLKLEATGRVALMIAFVVSLFLTASLLLR